MADGAIIKIELYPNIAPITVANFEKLVNQGFYNGLTFHRIVPGFVIQGGDPKGNGTGGSDQSIKGEFSANGWDNPLSQTRGVVAMARSSDYNSASSQFYICLSDSDSQLDGQYAAFGKVISGMDEVDKIAKVKCDSNSKPLKPVVMKTVTMEK
jgi:peptidyl-prolyl cis-trans isomerase B (cyclophilin B)